MAESKKIYWKGLEELTNDPKFVQHAHDEFYKGEVPSEASSHNIDGDFTKSHRRDFLKMMGFSLAAASLAACEAPVRKAIPLIVKPEEYDPSIANWYASTWTEGGDYASILVKTREGRPIKIEGNKLSSVSRGGTNARIQASVLSLYDTNRYKGPQAQGKATSWEDIDKAITEKLASAASIRIISNTIISPTALKAVNEFKAKYPNAVHVVYDPISASGIVAANQASFGVSAIPSYRFDKAKTIVTFSADFLGTWLSPVEFASQYGITRKLGRSKKEMSRLYVFEGNMSLTGCNADVRQPVRPSEEGLYVAALYNKIAAATGAETIPSAAVKDAAKIDKAAKDLLDSKGASLVVCGSNDPNVQIIVNRINTLLGNYGATIDLESYITTRQGNDKAMKGFIDEAAAGSVGAVIFWDCNPVYDFAGGSKVKDAIAKVPVKISLADRPDETAAICDYVAPDNHYLESWGDAEPRKGMYSLQQPTISPLFKTRQAAESLLRWAGNTTEYYNYLRSNWKASMFPMQTIHKSFTDFWNYTLHDGIFEVGRPNYRASKEVAAVAPASAVASADTTKKVVAAPVEETVEITPIAVPAPWDKPVSATQPAFIATAFGSAAAAVAGTYKSGVQGFDVIVYESIGLGAGKQANNPWLQEFSDPVTRACWDNYITIPVSYAKEKGITVVEGQTVLLELKAGGQTIKLPAMVQPGQAAGTVGIPVGYGREVTGITAKGVGKSAYTLVQNAEGFSKYFVSGGDITVTTEKYEIAHVQTHHTIMGRDVVQETTLEEYKKDPASGVSAVMIETANGPKRASELSIWLADHKYNNHFWGMSIDLNSCIGCGACTIACQAENNVPVVGKKEVLVRREMHWIRIDRYFSSDAAEGDLKGMEQAGENPEVVFQPMMCQHCNNAPCETVCPVAATTHSSEGLNQMAYNRCIGTRYCANNCPYKVRRFNWFSYPQSKKSAIDQWISGVAGVHDGFPHNPANNDLGRMVLNPDVTVRARGVMEKCSMCVQRIQDGKLNAKKEGRRPIDGEINTACATSCPTEAIVFGDMNDPDSRISQVIQADNKERTFRVLDEINTRPSVSYLSKIRNKA